MKVHWFCLIMSVTTKKKHVERELFEDFSLPEVHQSIVRVVRPRGNNLHQVSTPDGEEYIASMPPKYRKHVWIKRGDYVVTEAIPEGNKVRAEIVRILMKDHIRYIMQNNKWPSEFAEQDCDSKESDVSSRLQRIKVSDDNASESDSESEIEDDLLMENPNRQRVYHEETESSESESVSEEDNTNSNNK